MSTDPPSAPTTAPTPPAQCVPRWGDQNTGRPRTAVVSAPAMLATATRSATGRTGQTIPGRLPRDGVLRGLSKGTSLSYRTRLPDGPRVPSTGRSTGPPSPSLTPGGTRQHLQAATGPAAGGVAKALRRRQRPMSRRPKPTTAKAYRATHTATSSAVYPADSPLRSGSLPRAQWNGVALSQGRSPSTSGPSE